MRAAANIDNVLLIIEINRKSEVNILTWFQGRMHQSFCRVKNMVLNEL